MHSKCTQNDSSKEYKVKLEAVYIRLKLKSNRFEISVPLQIFFFYLVANMFCLHKILHYGLASEAKVQFVLPQSDWLNKSIVINSKFSNHIEFSNLCWRHDWNQTGSKFRYDLVIWTVIELKHRWYRHEFSHCTEICSMISCRQLLKGCRYFSCKRRWNVWYRGKFVSLKLSTYIHTFLFLY